MSYFSSKNDKSDNNKIANGVGRIEPARPVGKSGTDEVSTIASGMTVTGNIVCAGSLQIFGRVTGDIHAAHLAVREGAHVEGKVTAPDTLIEGTFNGTIHGNAVKLQKTAAVDGEIFNKTLSIEENARFEGVSRRLERAVEGPSTAQLETVTGGHDGGAPAFASAPPITATAK